MALAGVLSLYALLGFLLAPVVLKAQLTQYVHDEFGCRLALRQVRVHPFKLWVELTGIQLRDRKGEALFDAARFAVDFEGLRSIWERAYVFHAVVIAEPRLRVAVHKDGIVNLSDLTPLHPDPEPASEAPTAAAPRAWIQSFRLQAGRIAFEDCARKTCFARTFEQLALAVRDLRTTAQGATFSLSTRLNDGAQLAWKGSVAVSPHIASSGRLGLSNAALRSLSEYLGDALPVGTLSGRASLAGDYEVSLREGGKIRANIADLTLSDVRVPARTAAGGAVEIPKVQLAGAAIDLRRRSLDIASLTLHGLNTTAHVDADGHLNLANLIERREGSGDDDGPRWSVHVGKLELREAAVDAVHQLAHREAHVRFAPIGITVLDWTSDGRRPFTVSMQLGIQGTGHFKASGEVIQAPFAADLELQADGIELSIAQPYVLELAAFTLGGGKLGFGGKLAIRAGAPRLAFNGTVRLQNLHTLDNDQRDDLFNVRRMEFKGVRYEAQPHQLEIERIDVRDPYARVILRPNGTLNLTSAFTPKAPRGSAPTASAAPVAGAAVAPVADVMPIRIRIRTLAIERMRANFADTLIKPNFTLSLQRVSGTIRGISTDHSARAVVALKGTLGDNAPVSIDGTLRPFAYDRHTDIKVRAENISLPIFNPYSGRFAGYNISRGELTTEVHYKVYKRQLEASHDVRIDQLTWGEATDTKQEASLPVKLATVLLRDRDGVIKLDLPLHGTLDDPKFSIWPLIWQVIENTLVKVVTAPFDALAAVFSGTEDAKFVDFEPGSAELSPYSKTALESLSKALSERPELSLDVPIGGVLDLDRQGLLERKLKGQIEEALVRTHGRDKAMDFVSLDGEDQIHLLEKLYKERYANQPSIAKAPARSAKQSGAEAAALTQDFEIQQLKGALRSRITVTQGELDQLARDRAEEIERAVTAGGKLTTNRVLLTREREATAEQGKVRLALELE